MKKRLWGIEANTVFNGVYFYSADKEWKKKTLSVDKNSVKQFWKLWSLIHVKFKMASNLTKVCRTSLITHTDKHTVLPMTCMWWRPEKLYACTFLIWLSWIRSSTRDGGRFWGMEVRRLCEMYNFCKRFKGRNALGWTLEIWLYLNTRAWNRTRTMRECCTNFY